MRLHTELNFEPRIKVMYLSDKDIENNKDVQMYIVYDCEKIIFYILSVLQFLYPDTTAVYR